MNLSFQHVPLGKQVFLYRPWRNPSSIHVICTAACWAFAANRSPAVLSCAKERRMCGQLFIREQFKEIQRFLAVPVTRLSPILSRLFALERFQRLECER